MGKIKNQLLDVGLTQEELDQELHNRYEDEIGYQEWLESKEFVEYVNSELDLAKPRYSESDIIKATRYSSKSITMDPSEVGKEVYDMLFSEKIEEYLSSHI